MPGIGTNTSNSSGTPVDSVQVITTKISGTKFKVEPYNGTNWSDWKCDMEITLTNDKLWDSVNKKPKNDQAIFKPCGYYLPGPPRPHGPLMILLPSPQELVSILDCSPQITTTSESSAASLLHKRP